MRRVILPATLLAAGLGLLTALPAEAREGGCIKDGAAGAVAGHFVGSGHAVAGAAVGCAVGIHRRHEAERRDAQAQSQAPQNGQPNH